MKFFVITTGLFLLISLVFYNCSADAGKSSRIDKDSNDPILIDSVLFNKGFVLFKSDCNLCHVSKGRLHNFLDRVTTRLEEDYLKLFLTRQDSLIEAKDDYVIKLKNFWGNLDFNHQFNYSDDQLAAIIEYSK